MLGMTKVKTMWTTIHGSVAPTRKTDRDSEALAAYVRAEYGKADVAWFLKEVHRAAAKPKTTRSSKWTPVADGVGSPSG